MIMKKLIIIIKKFNLNFETIRTELKAIVGNGDFKLKRSIIHMNQIV